MGNRNRISRLALVAAPLAIIVILAFAGVAFAAMSIGDIDAVWGLVDGVNPGATCDGWATGPGDNPTTISEDDPGVQSPPTNDENQVRYGGFDTCALWGGRSGFGFDGANSPAMTVNTPFVLGIFTHYNRSTGALDPFEFVDATLTVPITCNDGSSTQVQAGFHITLDETINTAPCVYPGTTECPDKVTYTPLSTDPLAFSCDGQDYTLEVLGFVPGACAPTYAPGSGTNEFITEEDTNNDACVWAQINGNEPPPTETPPPDAGCTYTQGYWKNHANSNKHYDDAWDALGPDGPDTMFFDSGMTWLEVLHKPPKSGDAWYILAHQYIAAYLNVMNGASNDDIVMELADAAYLLDMYDGNGSGSPSIPKTSHDRSEALMLAGTLDQYNNGYIGPGHCDDE